MILVNRIDDIVSVSYNNKENSIPYNEEKFKALMNIADKSVATNSLDNLKLLFEEVETILNSEEEKFRSELYPGLVKDVRNGKFFLDLGKGVISSVAIPKTLVDRIETSVSKGIDITPVIKCWIRFLRNPKAKDARFATKFANYINMTYVRPDVKKEAMDKKGYSDELATKLATVYQVKITQEGLLNGYKVSKEVDWKFESDADNNPVRKPLYTRVFDPITGEVTSEGKDNVDAEDRTFYPAIQGLDGGDAFFCEGGKGHDKLGHIIKVGSTHRLPDWSFVNCNDDQSCVPGLHVGGLYYIAGIQGIIHNIFVDPAHIGAIPDDNKGVMRVIQYFVHSTWVGTNASIYHSSDYAKLTDAQWETYKAELRAKNEEKITTVANQIEEIDAL